MRKLLYSFVLLCIAIGFISCSSILKTMYGVKKPQLETEASIAEFLKDQNLDPTQNYLFKDFYSFAVASNEGYLSIPNALFFNRDGFFINYKKDPKDCNANIDKFILDLKNFNSNSLNNGHKVQSLLHLIKPQEDIEYVANDINVFITWTAYAGKLNKDKGFEWIALLEEAKNTGISVSYYLLNCDYQQNWNLTKLQLDKLGIKN